MFSLLEISAGAAHCPSGWGNPSEGGNCYKFMNEKGTWKETQLACEKTGRELVETETTRYDGASLALIGSSSDQEAVLTALDGVDASEYPQVYIGGFSKSHGVSGYGSGWYWKYQSWFGAEAPIIFSFFQYCDSCNKIDRYFFYETPRYIIIIFRL